MKIGTYQPERGSLTAWVFRIAHNRLVDSYRAARSAIAWDPLVMMTITPYDPEETVSDLQRAVITSQIAFADRGLPIVPDARLREYDYGDLTQYPVAQVEEEFPRRITEPFPNGESLLMVVQRVGAFLHEILREYEGKTVVVVGHRATRYGLEYWHGSA